MIGIPRFATTEAPCFVPSNVTLADGNTCGEGERRGREAGSRQTIQTQSPFLLFHPSRSKALPYRALYSQLSGKRIRQLICRVIVVPISPIIPLKHGSALERGLTTHSESNDE
ncbi:hypothetical protein ACMFMG_005492 [Clarireedia jacksonii]